MRGLSVIAAVPLLFALQASKKKAEGDATTQGVMHGIYAPMAVLLPLSFDSAAFADPKNAQTVGTSVDQLAAGMQSLKAHAEKRSEGFRYVAGSLERDVANVARLYHAGQFDQSRFVLHNLTENCVSCHSSLPESHKFRGAGQILAAVQKEKLEPSETARLLVMSRQFDEALTVYEKALEPGLANPVSFSDFVNYLKVSIRVKRDLKRPQQAMEHYLKVSPKNGRGRMQVVMWLDQLKRLDSQGVIGKPDIATARRVVEEGRGTMEFASDSDALIHYLVANANLSQIIHERKDLSRLETAEAYYLLGVTDSLIDESFWVSRLEFDLETAIRTAPEASFAPKAYAMLEKHVVFGYSGSGGTHIPEDVERKLKDLRELIGNRS